MGVNHATFSAATWMLATSQAKVPALKLSEQMSTPEFTLGFGLLMDRPELILFGVVLSAGYGMFADIDHHNSNVSKMIDVLPPFTTLLQRFAAWLGGGHRKGMHTPSGIPLWILVTWLIGLIQVDIQGHVYNVGSIIVVGLGAALTFRVYRIFRSQVHLWIAAAAFGVAGSALVSDNQMFIPLLVGIGIFTHMIGDFLTKGGIPMFAIYLGNFKAVLKPSREVNVGPFAWKKNGFMSLHILGRTGSTREHVLAWGILAPMAIYLIIMTIPAMMMSLGLAQTLITGAL